MAQKIASRLPPESHRYPPLKVVSPEHRTTSGHRPTARKDTSHQPLRTHLQNLPVNCISIGLETHNISPLPNGNKNDSTSPKANNSPYKNILADDHQRRNSALAYTAYSQMYITPSQLQEAMTKGRTEWYETSVQAFRCASRFRSNLEVL